MVGITADNGVTALLVTENGRYVIANKIEARRMMDEENLEALGFQLLEFPWDENREGELIRKICGDLTKVGTDGSFGECPNLDREIKKLRYSLTENEIERYAVTVPLETAITAYRELGYGDEWKFYHQGGAMGYLSRDIRV